MVEQGKGRYGRTGKKKRRGTNSETYHAKIKRLKAEADEAEAMKVVVASIAAEKEAAEVVAAANMAANEEPPASVCFDCCSRRVVDINSLRKKSESQAGEDSMPWGREKMKNPYWQRYQVTHYCSSWIFFAIVLS
jgi:hypothetical protein